jgi:hypothetical protein
LSQAFDIIIEKKQQQQELFTNLKAIFDVLYVIIEVLDEKSVM